MKLSEAIRLGAMMHPQAFHVMRDRDAYGRIVATCALGAAEAAGYNRFAHIATHPLHPDNFLSLHVPFAGVDSTIGSVIIDLNDELRWTREQIADWVEKIETSHAPHDPLSTSAGATDARPSEPCGTQVLTKSS